MNDKRQKLIKILNSSSTSLKNIISDVLDFSKIENDELLLEETSFYLRDIFEHVTSVMSVWMKEKNLDFAFSDEDNIAVLGHVPKDLDIEFDVARTGLEAVNQWKENHCGLILMDIQMQEMDGFSSARLIGRLEKETDIDRTPIVGMTAHAMAGDKAKCLAAGIWTHIYPSQSMKLN